MHAYEPRTVNEFIPHAHYFMKQYIKTPLDYKALYLIMRFTISSWLRARACVIWRCIENFVVSYKHCIAFMVVHVLREYDTIIHERIYVLHDVYNFKTFLHSDGSIRARAR